MHIRPMTVADLQAHEGHFKRHQAENGRGDTGYFMPFEPDDEDATPSSFEPETLTRAVTEAGWRRHWLLLDGDRVVGDVNIKGPKLVTGLHRCVLGIGMEAPYRGQGHGRALMQAAIDYARSTPSLTWLDLRVFGHNESARALYRDMGFEETGLVRDCFRLGGDAVDDVMMTLSVG